MNENDHIATLIREARGGSDEAIGNLIESVRTYLLFVANKEIDSQLRQKIAASDVVQDACLAATNGFEGFRGESEVELRAWLRKTLLNSLADARRKYVKSQKRKISREVEFERAIAMPSEQLSPSTSMITREESVRLTSAMERLRAEYRTVLQLRNWELLSFEQIGHRMNRSADAAQKLWTRALKQLERELEVLDGD